MASVSRRWLSTPIPADRLTGSSRLTLLQARKSPCRGGAGPELRFSWLPDGSGILLAAKDKSSAPVQLWIVTYPGGGVRRLTNDLSSYVSASVSADGRTIASVQQNLASSLWVGAANAPDNARQVTSGRFDGMKGSSGPPIGGSFHTS